MMRIKNISFYDGSVRDLTFSSETERVIDGKKLLALPGLIDPHVHFRVPGLEAKEDWKTGAKAAICGGITHVLDMPNTLPPTTTQALFTEKKLMIDTQLKQAKIPLRYGLYFGAHKNHLDEIEKVGKSACAVKVFMGCSTGGLLIDDELTLETVFQKAKKAGLIVAVHAEDEALLQRNKKKYVGVMDPSVHSKIRSKEAAVVAAAKAIKLCAKYDTPLYILHMSTKEEVELVRKAKKEGVSVFAEACSHHLFLDEKDYEAWGTLVQMNPPLRTKEDQEALWEAVNDGIIDTIGTDHAPHELEEKKKPYGQAPSGIPGVETLLPLLLDAVNRKLLTMEKLILLTRRNIEKLFSLPSNEDLVIVDLALEKAVRDDELKTKCGWSPFAGRQLKGWPVFTVLKGNVYDPKNI